MHGALPSHNLCLHVMVHRHINYMRQCNCQMLFVVSVCWLSWRLCTFRSIARSFEPGLEYEVYSNFTESAFHIVSCSGFPAETLWNDIHCYSSSMLYLKLYIYSGLLVTCTPVIEIRGRSGQFWANYSCLFPLVIQLWSRSQGRGVILRQSLLRDWWHGWRTKSQTVFNSSAARTWSCTSVVALSLILSL